MVVGSWDGGWLLGWWVVVGKVGGGWHGGW